MQTLTIKQPRQTDSRPKQTTFPANEVFDIFFKV